MQIKHLVSVVALLLSASLAQAELAVIVNPQNPVAKLSADEAAQYFLGKSKTLTPLDYTDGTGPRSAFYSRVLQKDPSQVKAIWTKLVFTGKGVAPRELPSVAEMKKAVAANPNAIGYVDKSAVDDSVKVVFTLP